MIRICFCIDSLKIGGAENLLIDLIRFWNTRRWEIFLFCHKHAYITRDRLPLEKLVNYECVDIQRRDELALRAGAFCRKNRIDIASTHLEQSNMWFGLGSRLAGARLVTTIHSVNIYDELPYHKRLVRRVFYNNVPNKIIAVSQGVAGYLKEFGINPAVISVIENGIDVSTISRKYAGTPNYHRLALVFVGRIEPQKGLDVLLDALAIVNSACHNWSLDIIGDGSATSAIKEKIAALGLRDIRLLGMKSRPLEYLSDKTLFCMPSRREGLPISLLEALAMGLPPIVSNVGALPTIIEDGVNGFVCEAGNPLSFARKILEFTKMTRRQRNMLCENARRTAEQYDIRRCVDGYERLFLSLLKR